MGVQYNSTATTNEAAGSGLVNLITDLSAPML